MGLSCMSVRDGKWQWTPISFSDMHLWFPASISWNSTWHFGEHLIVLMMQAIGSLYKASIRLCDCGLLGSLKGESKLLVVFASVPSLPLPFPIFHHAHSPHSHCAPHDAQTWSSWHPLWYPLDQPCLLFPLHCCPQHWLSLLWSLPSQQHWPSPLAPLLSHVHSDIGDHIY